MAQINEQLAAFNKVQLESALQMAQLAAESMEKLADVQYRAAKAAYADSVNTVRQLLDAKDVGELAQVTAAATQPSVDKLSAYGKELYGVLAANQNAVASALEQQLAEFNQAMLTALDGAVKAAPPGSEASVAAFKSVVHTANTMYESMVRAAKQMAGLAQTSMSAIAQAGTTREKTK